jgi:hypothetical protein
LRTFAAIVFYLLPLALAGETLCPCNPNDPATLRIRQCELCAVVEKAPPDVLVVFAEDSSPVKPDRTLALPRQHSPGLHQMAALSPESRTALWREAIAKAKELWGDQWGLAYNAEKYHTQCHVHVHIGKLIEGVEAGEFIVVDRPEDIPLPGVDGLWIHPVNGRLHVHLKEQVTETVLLR